MDPRATYETSVDAGVLPNPEEHDYRSTDFWLIFFIRKKIVLVTEEMELTGRRLASR